MTRKHQPIYYLMLADLALSLTALACGTGYRTSSKLSGNSGSVRVQLKEADGVDSTSVEINEDWSYQRVAAEVTFSLESGSCQAAIRGEEHTAILLEAASGRPGQSSGQLVTNTFGDVTLETDCQGGQNLDLTIAFTR